MFYLTKQEKIVLLVLAFVFLWGTFVQFTLKRYPFLGQIVDVMDGECLIHKTDINTADEKELEAVPYIGPYTARQIVLHRQEKGPFTSLEQLKSVKGIRDKNFERFFKYLTVRREKKIFHE